MSSWSAKRIADLGLSLLVAAASLAVVVMAVERYVGRGPVQLPAEREQQVAPPLEPVSLEGLNTVGSPSGRVALIEFSDFECPYCGRFARETWPSLQREFVDTGVLVMAFVHAPDITNHRQAFHAAVAAECAGAQKKFWEMKTRLFASTLDLRVDVLRRQAEELGLDVVAFDSCASETGPAVVRAQMARVSALGIRGTPLFMVGQLDGDSVTVQQVVVGAKPLDEFRAAVSRVAQMAEVQR